MLELNTSNKHHATAIPSWLKNRQHSAIDENVGEAHSIGCTKAAARTLARILTQRLHLRQRSFSDYQPDQSSGSKQWIEQTRPEGSGILRCNESPQNGTFVFQPLAPPSHNHLSTSNAMLDAPVEVDMDMDEPASLDTASGCTSLSSSVQKYEYKHGRRYHGYHAGSYPFPNDQREQDRLDLLHHVYYRTLHNRLFLAPLDPRGMRILDIGTGTGRWALHMADDHPSARAIVGVDLSPIQPAWAPPHVRFVVDDLERDWVERLPYDFIHARYLAGAIRDWPRLVRQCFAHLRPGGWIELQETVNVMYAEDGTLPRDSYMARMMDGLIEAGERTGRTMDPAPSMETWVRDAGFTNITKHRFKIPVGSWPKDTRLKECGSFMRVNFVEGVEAFTASLFTEVLGWTPEEVQVLNAGVRKEAMRNDIHAIIDFLVVVAQKPC